MLYQFTLGQSYDTVFCNSLASTCRTSRTKALITSLQEIPSWLILPVTGQVQMLALEGLHRILQCRSIPGLEQ